MAMKWQQCVAKNERRRKYEIMKEIIISEEAKKSDKRGEMA